MKFWDFEGRWRLERQIDDRKSKKTARLDGEAIFERDSAELLYFETGQLRFPGQPILTSSQTYLWRPNGSGATVLFNDGRPFHFVEFESNWQTHHDCPPDWYEVRYDFARWPDWTSTWTVRGPRKDYSMVSKFRRAE